MSQEKIKIKPRQTLIVQNKRLYEELQRLKKAVEPLSFEEPISEECAGLNHTLEIQKQQMNSRRAEVNDLRDKNIHQNAAYIVKEENELISLKKELEEIKSEKILLNHLKNVKRKALLSNIPLDQHANDLGVQEIVIRKENKNIAYNIVEIEREIRKYHLMNQMKANTLCEKNDYRMADINVEIINIKSNIEEIQLKWKPMADQLDFELFSLKEELKKKIDEEKNKDKEEKSWATRSKAVHPEIMFKAKFSKSNHFKNKEEKAFISKTLKEIEKDILLVKQSEYKNDKIIYFESSPSIENHIYEEEKKEVKHSKINENVINQETKEEIKKKIEYHKNENKQSENVKKNILLEKEIHEKELEKNHEKKLLERIYEKTKKIKILNKEWEKIDINFKKEHEKQQDKEIKFIKFLKYEDEMLESYEKNKNIKKEKIHKIINKTVIQEKDEESVEKMFELNEIIKKEEEKKLYEKRNIDYEKDKEMSRKLFFKNEKNNNFVQSESISIDKYEIMRKIKKHKSKNKIELIEKNKDIKQEIPIFEIRFTDTEDEKQPKKIRRRILDTKNQIEIGTSMS